MFSKTNWEFRLFLFGLGFFFFKFSLFENFEIPGEKMNVFENPQQNDIHFPFGYWSSLIILYIIFFILTTVLLKECLRMDMFATDWADIFYCLKKNMIVILKTIQPFLKTFVIQKN